MSGPGADPPRAVPNPGTAPMAPPRRALLLGAGVLAAGLGVGLQVWRQPAGPPDAVEGLWASSFDTPAGGRLVMQGLRGRPVLLNFWATWCPPCVEELPLLDHFARLQPAGGLQVVGLAVDQPTAVRQFLVRAPVGFPMGLAAGEGMNLGRRLGNSTGGLPFTLVLNRMGEVVDRKMGALSSGDLERWAAQVR